MLLYTLRRELTVWMVITSWDTLSLLCIRDILGSKLDPETGCSD
jgi:hypothetical protein